MSKSRGYFGVGSEGISKAVNLGAILRTTHAFGGSFAFTVGGVADVKSARAIDTSGASAHMPFYEWEDLDALVLPRDCQLVGVELCEESLHLPSFRHPARAAYLLGPERGSLSDRAVAMCDHVVAIPTRFCLNIHLACALVLYDRVLQSGAHPERPVMPGGPLLSDVQGWVNPGSDRVPFRRSKGRKSHTSP